MKGNVERRIARNRRGASHERRGRTPIHEVIALDASARMIELAQRRKAVEMPAAPVQFIQLATEDLGNLEWRVDGIFSNFSGLNSFYSEFRGKLLDIVAQHGRKISIDGRGRAASGT